MNYERKYRVKNENIILNQELEFTFYVEEVYWKLKMKMKGYKIEKVK